MLLLSSSVVNKSSNSINTSCTISCVFAVVPEVVVVVATAVDIVDGSGNGSCKCGSRNEASCW